MRWCIVDVSPSAKERGRDNDPHLIKPEEIREHIDRGTVMLYFFEDTDDEDFPDAEKHEPICALQFWEGFLNRIQGGGGDNPIFKAMHKAFLPHEMEKKMTSEQLVAAIKEIEGSCSEKSSVADKQVPT